MRLVVIATFCLASLTKAQDVVLFESKVLPVLKQRCFECHSHEKKMKGGLTLDSKSGWEQGGDSGAAVVVGKPDESLLIKMMRWTDDDHQMPPKDKLPAAEIALLEEWVRSGAHDPAGDSESANG
jgi:mono/diheme cytochrome c family protein